MKIALISDQHFGSKNDSLIMLQYQKKFYDNIFFPYVDKHNINIVLDLGDTFDRRKYINYNTLSFVRKMYFDEIKKRGIDLRIILGNHSVYFRNTLEINSPNLLLNDYNFKIYDEAEYVDFDNLKTLFIPWITQENREHAFNLISESKASIIFGHLEIQGFEFMQGRICDHGMETNIFEKYLSVFSGHFHYKSYSNGIMYLGNPTDLTFADADVTKGFHILDTDTLELEFIENPYKLFYKIYYNENYELPEVIKDKYENAYIKVYVSEKTDNKRFENFILSLNKINAANVSIIDDQKINVQGIDDSEFKVEDTLTFISNYIKNMEIDNKKQISNLITDLYNQANELEIG